jgi:hypothetical protein
VANVQHVHVARPDDEQDPLNIRTTPVKHLADSLAGLLSLTSEAAPPRKYFGGSHGAVEAIEPFYGSLLGALRYPVKRLERIG